MNLTFLLGDVESSFLCKGLGKNIFLKNVLMVHQAADGGRHLYIENCTSKVFMTAFLKLVLRQDFY